MGASYEDNKKERNFEGGRDNRGNFKGGRSREGGGFRIRLSDNEMRAARSIQEAFNLRSTVAVLGFAIRALAQMLEEGKLDGLISEYRSQATRGNPNRNELASNSKNIKKANPFARPSKPETQKVNSNKDLEESEEINTEKEEVYNNDAVNQKGLDVETKTDENINGENVKETYEKSITTNN